MDKEKDIALENSDAEFTDEDIITLTSDDGEELDFYHEATVEYNDEWFVFLHPVEKMEEISDDEIIIFKLVKNENGEDALDPIEDEELLDNVYKEYVKLVESYEDEEDEEEKGEI